MHDLEKFQIMQRALVSIQARVENGEFKDHGLCSYLDAVMYEMATVTYFDMCIVNNAMNRLMMQWPEYSGNALDIIGQNPEDAGRLYLRGKHFKHGFTPHEWHWSTKSAYGRKRRELLAWLINRCEEITGQVI